MEIGYKFEKVKINNGNNSNYSLSLSGTFKYITSFKGPKR